MKTRILLIASLVLILAVPAFAQTRSLDLTGYVSWVDPNGEGAFEGGTTFDDVNIDFESEMGYGLGLNAFFSDRISVEFAATKVSSDVAFRSSNPAIPVFTGGALEMIPITATLQFHFNPAGRFDPYIGAGAAYVLFDDLDSEDDLDDLDIDSIELEDDAGFVANAGVSIDLTRTFALVLDAKYVPVSSAATAVFASGPGVATDVDINPLILSAGLSLQF